MNIENLVQGKIEKYETKNGLGHTAKIFLALSSVNHPEVKEHNERVALLAEAIAGKLKKDKKAAFFGGLLHDVGKILFPYKLFDGHDITGEEYEEIKKHALAGFNALKNFHAFTALCAGLHHALYMRGYGLKIDDFPKKWGLHTIKKVLEISAIISVADFIDAATHRQTILKDAPGDKSWETILREKYPEDQLIIDTALSLNR
ncbi:MAG: HD domain-containing protein [Patescibacteria group bacterium]|nr:HD domain-containing protein [Patescibacteria group bacterium]MDD5490593.1 HD domain-containing protein [Patescibacteria group bacterium]